jgi:hypothetical protein
MGGFVPAAWSELLASLTPFTNPPAKGDFR